MIKGLQITMHGEDLRDRIGERIRMHEAAIGAVDVRIKRRQIDWSFDVRAEHDSKTLGELAEERQHHRDRVLSLTLLHDNVVAEEVYALDRTDLRLAELISSRGDTSEATDGGADHRTRQAVDGLRLTIPGDELRGLLEQRIDVHQRRADRWKHEQTRASEPQVEDAPLLPAAQCMLAVERHTWRAEVLGFIRDHVDVAEVYRLSESDLAFAELLPEMPWR